MNEMFIFAFIGIVILGMGIWHFFLSSKARAKRALKKAPLVRIKDAVSTKGIVRLQGQLVYDVPAIAAPLSGRRCAYYEVQVQEKRSSGKNSYWKTIVDEKEGVDFWIVDPTGRARVSPQAVRTILTMDARFSSGFLNDPTPELEHFLSTRGKSATGLLFNKNMKYKEGVLEAGEEISVAGTCTTIQGTNSYTGEPETQIQVESTPNFKLVVTDDYKLATYVA